jgi:hypothetical protein
MPGKLELTPSQLNSHVTQIIAESCDCSASWAQHPGPMSQREIDEIKVRFTELMMRCVAPAEVSR